MGSVPRPGANQASEYRPRVGEWGFKPVDPKTQLSGTAKQMLDEKHAEAVALTKQVEALKAGHRNERARRKAVESEYEALEHEARSLRRKLARREAEGATAPPASSSSSSSTGRPTHKARKLVRALLLKTHPDRGSVALDRTSVTASLNDVLAELNEAG